MPTKPKVLDLAGWRKSQMVVTSGGTRSMTQRELGRKLGVGNSLICRIESGERWPSAWLRGNIAAELSIYGLTLTQILACERAQLRTWRAYSPDRKGKTP